MTLLMILFIVGSVVMAAVIFFGMLDTDVMPLSCPSCYDGGDEDLAGTHRPWYRRNPGGVHCRTCHTAFREHPNGSLVEDRPIIDE
jgi:hypothetical protein